MELIITAHNAHLSYSKHLQLNLFVYAVILNTDIVKSVIHLNKCKDYRANALNSAMNCIITSINSLAICGKESQSVLLRSR